MFMDVWAVARSSLQIDYLKITRKQRIMTQIKENTMGDLTAGLLQLIWLMLLSLLGEITINSGY